MRGLSAIGTPDRGTGGTAAPPLVCFICLEDILLGFGFAGMDSPLGESVLWPYAIGIRDSGSTSIHRRDL